MPRGKGNKIYDIPGKKAAAREEMLTAIAVVPPNGKLVLWSGDKTEDARLERAQGVARPARAARLGAAPAAGASSIGSSPRSRMSVPEKEK